MLQPPNNWIYHNTREGVYFKYVDDDVVIRDNTIAYNGRFGIKSNTDVNLSNCIVWGNNSDRGYIQLSGCSAIYSCITDPNDPEGDDPGADEPDEETGNISANPLFAYDDPNDYHLGPDSPCRDIGHDPNGDGSYYDNLDIDGNVRVYNARVDIGADEYTCDDIYNDVDWNSDRIVDVDDLIVLARAWLSDPCADNWNPDCDIQPENGDWDIDYGDFAVFGAQWLWEPCWTTSGPSAPMMMGMGGGMGRMAGAESMVISPTAPLAPYALQQASGIEAPPQAEPSVEEQIARIKSLLDWLYEVADTIDEKIWLSLVTSLEEMLKELQDSK